MVLFRNEILKRTSWGSAVALASLVRGNIISHMDTEDGGHLFPVVPNLLCEGFKELDVRDPLVCISMKMKVRSGCVKGRIEEQLI